MSEPKVKGPLSTERKKECFRNRGGPLNALSMKTCLGHIKLSCPHFVSLKTTPVFLLLLSTLRFLILLYSHFTLKLRLLAVQYHNDKEIAELKV
jgi:hypothetical protein